MTRQEIAHSAMATKLSRPAQLRTQERHLATAYPNLLLLLTDECDRVNPAQFPWPENAAVVAITRTIDRLCQRAEIGDRLRVMDWLNTRRHVLYPFSLAITTELFGTRTSLEARVAAVLAELSALPSDKTGLLWQFGESTYYFHKSYSHARVTELLQWPPKRERIERKADDLQVGALADDLARSLRSDNAPSAPFAP